MNSNLKEIQDKTIYILLILLILFGSAFFAFYVFKSFFWPILFSFLLYAIFEKLNKNLVKFIKNKSITALITIFIILIIVIIPFLYLIYNLLIQGVNLFKLIRDSINSGEILNLFIKFEGLVEYLTSEEFFWINYLSKIAILLKNYPEIGEIFKIKQIAGGVYDFFTFSLNLIAQILVYIIFTLIITYFLLQNGSELFQRISNWLPFNNELIERFKSEMKIIMESIVKGNFFISILQGFFLGIGFLICSIPNALFYGFLAGIFSLIPVIGTAIVWMPGAFYLYFVKNNLALAIFLSTYGLISYLILENLVKPIFLNKKIGISSILLFFAIIGGLNEFGIMGIILGPLLLALFITIWRIYPLTKESDVE